MSAATYGHNSHTLGICFLGDDSQGRDDVTAAGRQALVNLTRYLDELLPRQLKFTGHRDWVNTACPGNEIYNYVTGRVFRGQVYADNAKRLAALRRWVLARRAEGWGWKRIKASPNWREFVRRGGK